MIGLAAAAALLGLLTLAWIAWPRRTSAGSAPAATGEAGDDPRATPRLRIGLALALVVVTAGGYALWGTPAALTPGITHADPLAAANALPPEQREKLLRALLKDRQREVDRAPEDADAWAALARTQFEAAQLPQAVESFRRAAQLRPQDADTLVDLADVLAVQAERRMSPESVELVERALAIDGNHTKALALAGIAAFQRGDPAQAVAAWQRAIATAPEGHPIAAELKATLDQARQMAQGAGPSSSPGGPAGGPQAGAPGSVAPNAAAPNVAAASTDSKAPGGAEAITGRVTLAPALAARVQPDDTVFVFARAAEGSRMPLAIQRYRAGDLPISFTLDDRHAMSPAARLSGSQAVVVGARVSRSGNAMPQPGDLQGLSAAVTPGTAGLNIVISEDAAR